MFFTLKDFMIAMLFYFLTAVSGFTLVALFFILKEKIKRRDKYKKGKRNER